MSNENKDHTLDIQLAAGCAQQLLRSFQLSGIQTLPKPNGQHEFGFSAPLENPTVTDATGQAEKPSSAAAAGPIASTTDQSPATEPKSESTVLVSSSGLSGYESAPLAQPERVAQLQLIQTEVSNCTKCTELASCRKNTVFGVGNPKPRLCFLGEGPGADEDREGEPFVGAAGQLLNRIIESCKMQREDVYILNTVKCRPPGNRNPVDDELANCWPYAIAQLEILQPEFICCLGSVAAKTLLETKQSIGRMRGQFFQFRGSQVIVTYHPAYLLRNPSAKRQVWDDMKILLSAMGNRL